jgi:hypothetical protein
MSQNQIKWLAVVLMLIDHIGFMIESEPMRIIGRLSFPMFAWVFARNWERRKDEDSAEKLINRLILFGNLAQIPYILLLTNLRMNILISFALVAVTFNQVRQLTGNKKIMAIIIGCISAEILGVDYGWYSLICTLMMINLKGSGSKKWWVSWIIINILYCISAKSYIQIFGILTPAILSLHDTTKDKKPTTIEKKFFYYFYPIHLAGLAALRTIL